MGADRAEEYGSRNGVAGELLVRVHVDKALGLGRVRLMLAYVAGPLFDEGERWWIERIDGAGRVAAGFETFLPHRDNPDKTADNVRRVYLNDRGTMDRSRRRSSPASTG